MHLITIALALFGAATTASASIVGRQKSDGSVPGLAACANECGNAMDKNVCSGFEDVPCWCQNTSIIDGLKSCISDSCSQKDRDEAFGQLTKMCFAAGFQGINLPALPSGQAPSSVSGVAIAQASDTTTSAAGPAPTGHAASVNAPAGFFGIAAAGVLALVL